MVMCCLFVVIIVPWWLCLVTSACTCCMLKLLARSFDFYLQVMIFDSAVIHCREGGKIIWIAPSGGRDRPDPVTEEWYPVCLKQILICFCYMSFIFLFLSVLVFSFGWFFLSCTYNNIPSQCNFPFYNMPILLSRWSNSCILHYISYSDFSP